MITEHDLKEAIAECQGQRNPNATTCMQLAAFYTVKDHLYPEKIIEDNKYSYSAAPSHSIGVSYYSETEFGKRVGNMNIDDVLEVMDELMSAIQVLNPPLYKSVLRKL